MASLYKRDNSPFWWVKYRNTATGKTLRESTGFRVGVGTDLQKARQLRDEKSLAESRVGFAGKNGEAWDAWVPAFLETHYGGSPRSLERAQLAWRSAGAFLTGKSLPAPRHVTREVCLAFVAWRKTAGKVSHNGALGDLAFFSCILSEAVKRGFAQFNPAVRLGLKPEKIAEKPELTDEEVFKIRSEIAKLPEGEAKHRFRVSFEISLAQGCRIGETYLDVDRDVNLEAGTVQFCAKGKYYTTELNPALVPLIRELRAAGRKMAYEFPGERDLHLNRGKGAMALSLYWSQFFKRIGLGHLCFHSLRVTCVSRLHRAGVPETVAMRIVGHASETIHRVYRRIKREEASSAWAAYNNGRESVIPDGKIMSFHPVIAEKASGQ